jgi:hypothetical protein
MSGVNKIDVSIVERYAPSRGPTSSADYNATIQETINSLSQIALSWNLEIQPLLDSLPGGGTVFIREERTANPNPFLNGLDGSQLYLDLTSTDITDEGKYFNPLLSRPLTIKESLENVQSQLNQSVQDILVRIAKVSEDTGITARQKQAIGSRIFDPETSSNPTSLDGKLQYIERNLDQVAMDISGSLDYFTNSGAKSLVYTLIQQIESLQEAHNYNSASNTVNHLNLPRHIHRYHVVPLGLLNGVNRSYDIPGGEKFIANSLRVIVNGLELQKGIHYAERSIDRRGFNLNPSYPALENDGANADDAIWVHYDIDPNDT